MNKEFGTHHLPKPRGHIGYMVYCNRCDHITSFPTTAIGSNAHLVRRAKEWNFRVIERESWQEESNRGYCGSRLDETRMETKRENMDSCMNCNHARGYDCDEPWTENRCQFTTPQIAPFTVCDLHGKEVKWSMEERRYVVVGDYWVPGTRKRPYEMEEEIVNIPICPVCHGRDVEEENIRVWRCKTCRQWFLKKGEVLNNGDLKE